MDNPIKVRDYKRRFNQDNPMAKRYYNLKNKSRADMELTINEFYQWYDAEPKKCYYCDIPIDLLEIPDSYINRKSNGLFTIDRKDCNGNYAEGNLALSCQLCNLVKSNFFSADTMRELAQRYVKPRWQQKAGIEPDVLIPDIEELDNLRIAIVELNKKLDDREEDLIEAKREEEERIDNYMRDSGLEFWLTSYRGENEPIPLTHTSREVVWQALKGEKEK